MIFDPDTDCFLIASLLGIIYVVFRFDSNRQTFH